MKILSCHRKFRPDECLARTQRMFPGDKVTFQVVPLREIILEQNAGEVNLLELQFWHTFFDLLPRHGIWPTRLRDFWRLVVQVHTSQQPRMIRWIVQPAVLLTRQPWMVFSGHNQLFALKEIVPSKTILVRTVLEQTSTDNEVES